MVDLKKRRATRFTTLMQLNKYSIAQLLVHFNWNPDSREIWETVDGQTFVDHHEAIEHVVTWLTEEVPSRNLLSVSSVDFMLAMQVQYGD